VTNSNLTCGTVGVQSGTANAATEKLTPPVTPPESSASDQRNSGVVFRCFIFSLKTIGVLF